MFTAFIMFLCGYIKCPFFCLGFCVTWCLYVFSENAKAAKINDFRIHEDR